MNYDGLLQALGATPNGKRVKAPQSKYRVGDYGGGAKGGGDDDRAPEPYAPAFKKATLPRVALPGQPREAKKWIMEMSHQELAGVDGDVSSNYRVMECVPKEVLSILVGDNKCTDPDRMKQVWLNTRQSLARHHRSPNTYHAPLPRLTPVSPKSTSLVRIKRKVTTTILLSQPLDAVLAQYPNFAARFRTLPFPDQQTWRVNWGSQHPQIRACLDRFIAAGVFTEGVQNCEYSTLFQKGIFLNIQEI